jgi:UbiD family decarboxylase
MKSFRVWQSGAGGAMLVIISIEQQYAGHVKEAALLASQSRVINGVQGRYVIVVDEDIDPTNIEEVLWALCTRADPENDIDIIRRIKSDRLDPLLGRPAKAFFRSMAIIDACKPYEWIGEFSKSVDPDPEVIERVRAKWKELER